MKTCQRCRREFTPDESLVDGLAEHLGELFIETIGTDDIKNLCPDCIDELGILNVLGFDA
ncbi:MAG TPA: hypothetical protein ENO00_02750 [Deltaproteobacteria bacterium]|nr:hypothetical protein [Deltaproteobacteria bacterium]